VCHRLYTKAHYQANKPSYLESAKRSHATIKERNKKWIHDRKVGKSCLDCQGVFPAICLDFDHRPGEPKKASLAQLVLNYATLEVLEAEIARCDLVCSNCHRIRTFRRLHKKDPE
jgi:hypothetical protein